MDNKEKLEEQLQREEAHLKTISERFLIASKEYAKNEALVFECNLEYRRLVVLSAELRKKLEEQANADKEQVAIIRKLKMLLRI